ncbi:MAG: pyridine nucleotide-disulfide oxidoreductase [Flavobacterium sp.]|nr:MAG: pyridine nucleotide-disulfide oxidoreductase [Flavobacterium sp.]
MKDTIIDVLIIGAGPSGCVAASYLHNNNINIKVVEKNKFPRFVIGESLLPRCMDHFKEAGLLNCLNKRNYEKKEGARFIKGDVICEFDFSKKFTPGWDWTWQVPRADFDNTLTQELIRNGVDLKFEHEVIAISFDENGISTTTIKDENGKEYTIKAKKVIDSSGYGRVLPRLLDLSLPSKLPKHSSVFTHVNDTKRPEGYEGTRISFHITDTETWLWVIPFSNGKTSIGFVGPTEYLESFEGTTTEKLQAMVRVSEFFGDRFKDEEYLFEPVFIKNYSVSVKQLFGNGYVLTGNSTEFLDPVFSSGVTFATESALMAAKLTTKEIKGEPIDWQKEYADYILEGVHVFASYVKEWYTGNLQTLFFHRPENPEIKAQICAVLAGYVWDKTNPFVKKHDRIVATMAHLIKMGSEAK